MTKLKSLKRTMITCGAYLLLLAVLITGVTTAKYTDSVSVLASYGASSFNTVILGGRTDEDGNRIVEALSESIDAQSSTNFLPGMTYDSNPSDNTAMLYPFSISNGVTEENKSEIGVIFTVKLRTIANLPLVFSLKHGETMMFTGEAVAIEAEEEGDATWYEYSFYETAETMENGEEQSFILDNDALNYEDFTLVVEWPVTSDENGNTNSAQYMKEVEVFELLVESSSINMSGYTEVSEEAASNLADADSADSDPADSNPADSDPADPANSVNE